MYIPEFSRWRVSPVLHLLNQNSATRKHAEIPLPYRAALTVPIAFNFLLSSFQSYLATQLTVSGAIKINKVKWSKPKGTLRQNVEK